MSIVNVGALPKSSLEGAPSTSLVDKWVVKAHFIAGVGFFFLTLLA